MPFNPARAAAPPAEPVDLAAVLRAARDGGADGTVAYRRPGRVRARLERALFAATFAAARAGSAATLCLLAVPAAALGFELRVARDGAAASDRRIVILAEAPAARRGAGVYVIAVGPAAEVFVQAPHAFSDEGSDELALALFRAASARALGTNTVHRRGRAGLAEDDGEEPPDPGAADVAHDVEATFQIATRAWLAGGTPAALVQLHGFADGRVAADAVLSAATRAAAPGWLKAARGLVSASLPDARVAAYPDDVASLGGRTNVQGRAARRAGARFLHVELSASLRRTLRRDPEAREALLGALAAATRGPAAP